MSESVIHRYYYKWENHHPNFISVFSNLLDKSLLVDVTLAVEGKYIQAHKVVLSSCSPYFETLFSVNPCKHPIVILTGISFEDLSIIINFIYSGELQVSRDHLSSLTKSAEILRVKGLMDVLKQNAPAIISVLADEGVKSESPERGRKRTKSRSRSSSADNIALIEKACIPIVECSVENVSMDVSMDESALCEQVALLTPQSSEDDASKPRKRARTLKRQQCVEGERASDDETQAKGTTTTTTMTTLERQNSDPTPTPKNRRLSKSYTTLKPCSSSNYLDLPAAASTVQLTKQISDSVLSMRDQDSPSLRTRASSKTSLNHCPLLREGPALGCNFCWNTIDERGRILRRKTKYHCPDCRTSLCIVPCFQEFHNGGRGKGGGCSEQDDGSAADQRNSPNLRKLTNQLKKRPKAQNSA